MLNFIQVAISRVINKLKVYFQKKSSPEKFYSSIKNKPIAEQERELDRLTKYILKTKDKKYYQNLLSVLVPSLDLNIEQSDFDAFGIGGSSLNTFRKITFGNEVYFEKVYFNSSIDLQRIVWF